MMSVTSPALAVASPSFGQPRIDCGQIPLAHVRQHEILLVAYADFRDAELLDQIGQRVELFMRSHRPARPRWA